MAREDVGTKFMSPGQATGAAISYARKYALGGMFAIDNEQDIDSQEYQQKRSQASQKAAGGAANMTKGSNDKDMRRKALEELNVKMQKLRLSGGEVSAIAGVKFGKVSDKELTTGELCQLVNNLETWVNEQMGASA
jgi:hypothetical protein